MSAGAPSGGGSPAADGRPRQACAVRLEVRQASKTFDRTRVLDHADLTVAAGEIHGLVGQNGSGKSTLIKLLSGFHAADAGSEFLVDGDRLGPPVHPEALQRLGVSFVHQDLGLVETSSVADNVRVGRFGARRVSRLIRRDVERAAVLETFERLGVAIDPDASVGGLSAAQRAVVAIARALQSHERGAGLIVFDESTQSLPREVLVDFYDIVRGLAAEGTGVLIVSHRLDEIMSLTHRVSVLRDGRVTGGGVPTASTSERELTELMLGRTANAERLQVAQPTSASEVALRARELRGRHLDGLDLELRRGEVVGVTGATDSGFEELAYLLAGAQPGTSGEVTLGQRTFDLHRTRPGDLMRAGVALVPESRAQQGLALELSVRDNLTVGRVRDRSPRWWLRTDWQDREFQSVVDQLGITPRRSDLPASALSGGNQQKLLLGKWLLGGPAVLVAHEPTQAVDVGARRDILSALRAAAQAGAAVLVASMESDDLAAVCDRVLVLSNGRHASELTGSPSSAEILDSVYQVSTLEQIGLTTWM